MYSAKMGEVIWVNILANLNIKNEAYKPKNINDISSNPYNGATSKSSGD